MHGLTSVDCAQVEREKHALQQRRASESKDAETQWRHFVKSMESWNRIVMNLVRAATCCAGCRVSFKSHIFVLFVVLGSTSSRSCSRCVCSD